VAFRAAHQVVGRLVERAEALGADLGDLPDGVIAMALAESGDPVGTGLVGDTEIGAELRRAATLEGALESADVIGGTAPARVQAAIAAARERLARELEGLEP
jgi:argininosuccinate lyase